MNGSWNRHRRAAKNKGMRVLSEIERAKSNLPKLPIALTDIMFNSIAIPVILYGAEVWGTHNTPELNKVMMSYYKRILGVPQATANCGVLWELGSVNVKTHCQQRCLKYWWEIIKGKRNEIVRECYDELAKMNLGWAAKLAALSHEIGVADQRLDGETCMPFTWNHVKKSHEKFRIREIVAERETKKSLEIQKLVGGDWGRKTYIDLLSNNERAGLAWFRLGNWKQNKITRENVDVCALCGEQENWEHILLNCQVTEPRRISVLQAGNYEMTERDENLGLSILRNNQPQFTRLLGQFFSAIRKIRHKALTTHRLQ